MDYQFYSLRIHPRKAAAALHLEENKAVSDFYGDAAPVAVSAPSSFEVGQQSKVWVSASHGETQVPLGLGLSAGLATFWSTEPQPSEV